MLAGVSRSGYYAWIKNPNNRTRKEVHDKEDFHLILQAYKFKNRYKGARGIKMVLFRQYSLQMNLKKIRRLMKKYHLVCPIRKAIKSHTAKNLLERNFNPGIPEKVLLTDITYIYYASGKCAYLSTVKDGCTKQIAAYHLGKEIQRTKKEIDEYIEYYNNFRYQWELEQMSPNEYYTYLITGKKPY